jgi:hypothetical protein
MAIQTPHVRSFFEQTGSLPVLFGTKWDPNENKNQNNNSISPQNGQNDQINQDLHAKEDPDKKYLFSLLSQLNVHQEESNKHFTFLLQKQTTGSFQSLKQ